MTNLASVTYTTPLTFHNSVFDLTCKRTRRPSCLDERRAHVVPLASEERGDPASTEQRTVVLTSDQGNQRGSGGRVEIQWGTYMMSHRFV